MTFRQLVLSLAGLVAFAVSVAPEPGQAQPPKTAPTKKPAPSTTAASPATAARGRSVSTPAGRAVNGALKTALANANVRNAVRAEVMRQLRVRRPFAVVNGYLVSAIDLAPVYQTTGVRSTLLAALGVNGPQLIDQARVSADRMTLVFTPATFGRIVMPKFTSDITASVGVKALTNHMTDVAPVVMILVLGGSGTLLLIEIAESFAAFLDWLFREDPDPTSPDRDYDGDGLTNAEDPDDDNDGVADENDNYPYDKDKSICDCGRPALSLVKTSFGDFLPSLVTALNATQAQRATALSLGVIIQGQAPSLALVF